MGEPRFLFAVGVEGLIGGRTYFVSEKNQLFYLTVVTRERKRTHTNTSTGIRRITTHSLLPKEM